MINDVLMGLSIDLFTNDQFSMVNDQCIKSYKHYFKTFL
jgi:hypothetical protein